MRFSTKIGLSAIMAALILGPLLGVAVFLNARSLLLERIVFEQVKIASGVVAEIDTVLAKAAGEMNVMAADNFLREIIESPAEYEARTETVADELGERAEMTGPWLECSFLIRRAGWYSLPWKNRAASRHWPTAL